MLMMKMIETLMIILPIRMQTGDDNSDNDDDDDDNDHNDNDDDED
jgi:hypothetical protein